MRTKIGGLAAGFDPSLVQPRRAAEPKTAPGQMAQFSVEFQRVEQEARELREHMGEAQELALALIDESPFQVRTIREEDVQELADNLAVNPLATPVVVRKVGERYELIAGHRRTRAFKRLGRAKIPAVIRQLDDDATERALVFDNLLIPSLPDWEKYLGVAKLRERHGWSYSQISEKTGLSKALVGFLFAFGKLPAKVQAMLASQPRLMGANFAMEMAKFAETNPKAVETVCARLAAKEINPTQAIAALKAPSSPSPAPSKPEPTVFKRGKKPYAELVRAGSVITVKLADQGVDDADALHSAIQDLVQAHASRK